MKTLEGMVERALSRCEGRTVPLNRWQIDLCDDSGEWVLVHYVGGEDYETYGNWFGTREEAVNEMVYLNNTLPPQGYTHYYTME